MAVPVLRRWALFKHKSKLSSPQVVEYPLGDIVGGCLYHVVLPHSRD